MDAHIRIVSRSEGNLSAVEGNASLEEGFPARVSYENDGDVTVLSIGLDRMEMRREGSAALEAVFSAGERSEMAFGCGGGRGAVPLLTERYEATCAEREISVKLVYKLLFGERSQTFDLDISICKDSEGK